MADETQGEYRTKALERISSPERLDELLRVTDRRSWLPLMTLGGLLAVLVAWSIFGRVPINVQGKGILVPPRKVLGLHAPAEGQLLKLNVQVGDQVATGEVIGIIEQFDLKKQIEIQRARLAQLKLQSDLAEEIRKERTDLETSSSADYGKSLSDHIQNSTELATRLRDNGLKSIQFEREGLEEHLQEAKQLAESFREELEGNEKLLESGILARPVYLKAKATYVDGTAHVRTLEVQLRALDDKEIEVEEQYLQRMQKVEELRFQLRNLNASNIALAQDCLEDATQHERLIADTERELSRLELQLKERSEIVCEHSGRVLELNVGIGEMLGTGSRIGAMAVEDLSQGFEAITYMTVRDGKRLKEGMRIQVTPDTVERQRFGSILGTVRSISPFPVTLEETANVVGNRTVAESLIKGGFLIQVFADLETDEATHSKFKWSSSDGPELDVSAGTTTTARIAVEQRPPLAFVLPFLKSVMGID